MMKDYWVTFYSHFDAITFRSLCKQRGLCCHLQSVPRFLSSSCGTAANVKSENEMDFFEKAEAIYVKEDGVFKELYHG